MRHPKREYKQEGWDEFPINGRSLEKIRSQFVRVFQQRTPIRKMDMFSRLSHAHSSTFLEFCAPNNVTATSTKNSIVGNPSFCHNFLTSPSINYFLTECSHPQSQQISKKTPKTRKYRLCTQLFWQDGVTFAVDRDHSFQLFVSNPVEHKAGHLITMLDIMKFFLLEIPIWE